MIETPQKRVGIDPACMSGLGGLKRALVSFQAATDGLLGQSLFSPTGIELVCCFEDRWVESDIVSR